MATENKLNGGGRIGRKLADIPTGPGSAMARFMIDYLPTLDMTNQEIADQFGYARPNIVSAWKTQTTKVTLDIVFGLAEMFDVDPSYMLALYIDQYVSSNDGVDRFDEIVGTLSRCTTEDEWEIIKAVRTARRHNSQPMTEEQKMGVLKLFELPITTPEGPYAPLDTMQHVKPGGNRKKFVRRGQPRDMKVSEIEEAEAHKAEAATKPGPVRKQAAGKKAKEPVTA